MHLGLFDINQAACLDPAVLGRVARAAEAAGLESLWGGEHVVLRIPVSRRRRWSRPSRSSIR